MRMEQCLSAAGRRQRRTWCPLTSPARVSSVLCSLPNPESCRQPPKAYLVSFDISRAFDGVPTAQLLALAQRLLARPAYTIV